MRLLTTIARGLLMLFVAPVLVQAENTAVDTSYGPEAGHYRFNRDISDDWVQDSAVDSQGRTLLAFLLEDQTSPGVYYPAVIRLKSDGYSDPSFGFLGLWLESTIDATPEVPIHIAVDSQDRPILGWTYEFDQLGIPNRDCYIRRLSTSGATDIGKVLAFDIGINNSGDRLDEMYDLVVLPDGRIVAVGQAQFDGADWDMFVGIFEDDGSGGLTLDTGFDSDGRRTVAFDLSGSSKYDTAQAVLQDNSGNLVLVGWSHSSGGNIVAVSRIDATTGASDASFDSDGRATYTYSPIFDPSQPARGLEVALGNSGLIIGAALGHTTYTVGFLGILNDGSVDLSFGTNGWHHFDPTYPGQPFTSAETVLSGMVRDYDRLYFSAAIGDPLDSNQRMGIFGVMNLSGAMDTSFSPGGFDYYRFEPDGEQMSTGFESVLVPDSGILGVSSGKAILTGSMRGVTGGGSRTDGDLLATRVYTAPVIFADGFESGNTSAWSAP